MGGTFLFNVVNDWIGQPGNFIFYDIQSLGFYTPLYCTPNHSRVFVLYIVEFFLLDTCPALGLYFDNQNLFAWCFFLLVKLQISNLSTQNNNID